MIPLLPAAIFGLAVLGASKAHKAFKNKGKLTQEREDIFNSAMRMLEDPEKLRGLADAYEKEGLRAHADLLRKRAALRELPPEVKKARGDAYRKGMNSTDEVKVRKLADLFEAQGAVGAANKLREHADALSVAAKVVEAAANGAVQDTSVTTAQPPAQQ